MQTDKAMMIAPHDGLAPAARIRTVPKDLLLLGLGVVLGLGVLFAWTRGRHEDKAAIRLIVPTERSH